MAVSVSGSSATFSGTTGAGTYPIHLRIYQFTPGGNTSLVYSQGGQSGTPSVVTNPITIDFGSAQALFKSEWSYWVSTGPFPQQGYWVLELTHFFIIDRTAPLVTSTFNRSRGGTINFSYTATDVSPTIYEANGSTTDGTGIYSSSLRVHDNASFNGVAKHYSINSTSSANFNGLAGSVAAPGQYYFRAEATDGFDTRNATTANRNTGYSTTTSFVVDPIPTSGPSASVYTTLSPLALQITRTDGTCDLSRYEIYCDNVLWLYAEGSEVSDVCDFSTLNKTLRNRTVEFRGYQINWTGTSPASQVTSDSGCSYYRTRNMRKRKHTTIEKRASWLNGVTP